MCVYGDETSPRTIALVGGSHAEHWISGLDEVGKHYGFRVITVLKMGCPLTLDATVSDNGAQLYESCAEWTPEALAALAGLQPDFVFTNATLEALAAQQPRTLAELAEVPGLGDKRIEAYGTRILDAIDTVLNG